MLKRIKAWFPKRRNYRISYRIAYPKNFNYEYTSLQQITVSGYTKRGAMRSLNKYIKRKVFAMEIANYEMKKK